MSLLIPRKEDPYSDIFSMDNDSARKMWSRVLHEEILRDIRLSETADDITLPLVIKIKDKP